MFKGTTIRNDRFHRGWLILVCSAPGVLGGTWGLVTVLLVTSDSSDPFYPLMYTLFLVLPALTVCLGAFTVHTHHRKNKEHPRG